MMSHSTIYALSTGALPSGVAVIRLSGPLVPHILEQMIGSVPIPRQAVLKKIRTRNGLLIDHGLVLFFPNPASFTGEDCAEFHIHGGKAVVQALLEELEQFCDVRLAQEGEFSRRAFENNKLDLLEVEGLADMLAAETEMQRRLAVEQSSGAASQLYDSWAQRLTRARALIEAELDFPDEEDIPGSVSDQVWQQMRLLEQELRDHLEQAATGEIVRDGYKIVLAGEPNAGKSSLLNALAARDVAIVTEFAGTTRDILQVDLNWDGFLIKLFDTAGLRDSSDMIEQEGIRRAHAVMATADLVLHLHDPAYPSLVPFADHINVLTVATKADQFQKTDLVYDCFVSAKTGQGLGELRQKIIRQIETKMTGSFVLPTRLRHRAILKDCLSALQAVIQDDTAGLDLRAENLRSAANSLGRITGRVDVEGLLDVIFSEFCIGK